MLTAEDIAEEVVAGYSGDADAIVELFAEDAVLTDNAGERPVVGQDAILAHFLAYGGRRETAAVHDCFVEGTRGGLALTVWFRADAAAYGQHTRVLLTFDDDGLITRWDGVWVELASDLSPWQGD